MNIEARKIIFIEDYLRVSDESIISKLEHLLKTEKKKLHERELHPMSVQDFNAMIDYAEADIKKDKIISQDDLKNKIKTWK